MKKLLCLLFIMSTQLYGMNDPLYEMPQPLYGRYNLLARFLVTSYNDKAFDTPLTIKGAFKGTKLKTKDLVICGPIEIKDSTIDGSIETSGSLIIENSTVTGKVKAKGAISAKDVNFLDSIEGNTVLLKNSFVKKDVDATGTEQIVIKDEYKTSFWYAPTVIETNITGSLRAANSLIRGKVKTKGRIWGKSSKFESVIEGYDLISLDEPRFGTKETAKDIHIKGKGSVLLEGNVTIGGTIYYESEKWNLLLSPSTTIIGGVQFHEKVVSNPIINGKTVE